jgi:hypothetical protein
MGDACGTAGGDSATTEVLSDSIADILILPLAVKAGSLTGARTIIGEGLKVTQREVADAK